ncbi:hypothetical protein [Alkaliphilus crotonatoxidans]
MMVPAIGVALGASATALTIGSVAVTGLTIATGLTGLGLVAAALSKLREGIEEINYASKGDLETKAFNPLRDIALGGDDEKLAKVEEGLMLLATLQTTVTAPFMMINQTGGQANQQAMKSYEINFKKPNFTGGFNVNGGALVMDQSPGISIPIPAVSTPGVILTGQQMTDLTIAYSANNGGGSGNGGGEKKNERKTGVNKDGEMLGKNGTRVDSKTLWQDGKTERVDVENPKPGQRPGDVHYHDSNNVKYRFDPVTGKLYDEVGNLGPNKIQKVLQIKDVQRAINKGLQVLGEEKYFK